MKTTLCLKLYKADFPVHKNYSTLHHLVRSLVLTLVVILVFLIISYLAKMSEFLFLILMVVLFAGGWYYDKKVRSLYPDWPKRKHFIGGLELKGESLATYGQGNNETFSISDISEFVAFTNYFLNHKAAVRDFPRNGNGLFFVKLKNGSKRTFCINVSTESEYERLQQLLEHYKTSVPYLKLYETYEIPHIMTSDLSDRVKYS